MKKTLIIVICSVLPIIIFIATTVIIVNKIYSSSLPDGKLLVMNSAIYSEPFEGLSIIDLKSNKTRLISSTGRYSLMDYCKKRNSIFAVSAKNSEIDIPQIYEINLDSKKTIPVKLKISEGEQRQYEYLKCVPNKNAISYSSNGEIYIYDFDTEDESVLINDDGEHSWNKSGTKVLYVSSADFLIHEYNLVTKKDTNLKIDGYAPQYSSDEKFITFFNSKTACVRRISDGFEWVYSKKCYVGEMHFCQDSSRLIMFETTNQSFCGAPYPQLICWDYKADKVKKLDLSYSYNTQFLLID